MKVQVKSFNGNISYHDTEWREAKTKNKLRVFGYYFDNISEPEALFIIPSGWTDRYHCIIEDGVRGNSEHHLITSSEIIKRFGINIKEHSFKPLTDYEEIAKKIKKEILRTTKSLKKPK